MSPPGALATRGALPTQELDDTTLTAETKKLN